MSLNRFMHPRNPYKQKKPDFKALAVKYDFFRQFVSTTLSGKCVLDFKRPEALKALLKVLLREDFDIDIDIPVDRLIPTLPLRINYLLWIEDLLKLFFPNVAPEKFLGIDVGAGASCIYAILGSKFFGWNFISLEVDDVSLSFASSNVEANDLASRVRLNRVSPEERFHDVLTRVLKPEDADRIPFLVCNPPFFADDCEMREGTTRKEERPQPWSVSSASSVESVTVGGEVGFVRRLIESSLLIRSRVGIYTTMLGKQSSISPLKIFLRSHHINQIGSYEFCQGRTMRWGLCWVVPPTATFSSSSIHASSPSSAICLPISPFRAERKNAKPFKLIVPKKSDAEYKLSLVAWRVKSLLEEIKVERQELPSDKGNVVKIKIKSFEKTWTNQRRKRREKLREMKRMALKRGATHDDELVAMETGDSASPQKGATEASADGKSCAEAEQPSVKRMRMDDEDEGFVAEEDTTEISSKNSSRSSDADSLSPVSPLTGVSKDTSIETPSPGTDLGMLMEDGCGFEDGDDDEQADKSRGVPIVDTTLSITKPSHHIIEVELHWEPGQDRDVLYELLQFFKNRLK